MADISDVEQTIADTVNGILYPDGVSSGSIVGAICRVYRGWPNSGTLNADLSVGIVNVTVSSDNELGVITTRYLPDWTLFTSMPTLSATVAGNSIVVEGLPKSGSAIGVLIDGIAVAYRVCPGDTIYQVAANLCAEIRTKRPAHLSGYTVTVPGAYSVNARVVADGVVSYEERRQQKDLRLIFWCPSPATRDSIATAVDLSMSQQAFLVLPDGSSARVTYKNSLTYDQSQNALLYRRDLQYNVEYPTIVSAGLPTMLFGGAGINGFTTLG